MACIWCWPRDSREFQRGARKCCGWTGRNGESAQVRGHGR